MKVRAVLFDYGGTLVAPRRPWPAIKTEGCEEDIKILKRRGLRIPRRRFLELDDAVFAKYADLEAKADKDIGDKIKYAGLIRELFPDESEERRKELASHATARFWDVARRNYELKKGVKRCLRSLATSGIRLGVVSNHHNQDSLVRMLGEEGILHHFRAIMVSEKVGVRKPDSRIFERALGELRTRGSQTVFVGDSLDQDIGGAKRAGLTAVLVRGGEQPNSEAREATALQKRRGTQLNRSLKPDFTIESLEELPEIIASLSKSH